MPVLGFAHHAGLRLAEVGFLLILIAGIWLALGEFRLLGLARWRRVGAGVLLSAAGVLLIVATHWGHFG